VPFTHQQKVNCIRVVDAYVLTAGTEGLIRAWQFMAAEGAFLLVAPCTDYTHINFPNV